MPLPAFLVAAAKLAVRRPQRPRLPTWPPWCGTGGTTSAASLTPSTTPPTPLADFRALPSSAAASSEDDDFFFGLVTAPAHVEDRLEDDWLQFATEHSCNDKEVVHDQKPADAVMASAGGDGGSQQASRSTGDEKASDGEQRKPIKVAMEAMLRGFEKFAEGGESDGGGNCSHNVAAWHNVPCPYQFQRETM